MHIFSGPYNLKRMDIYPTLSNEKGNLVFRLEKTYIGKLKSHFAHSRMKRLKDHLQRAIRLRYSMQ